jgi:hypothetical protein
MNEEMILPVEKSSSKGTIFGLRFMTLDESVKAESA